MVITSSRQSRQAPAAGGFGVRRWLPAVAVAAAAAWLAGCQGSRDNLAARNTFFASPSSVAGQVGLAARAVIEAHQDLLVIQRTCGATSETGDPEEASVVCDLRATPFHGRRAEAYRRWVDDQIRPLPSPDQTATGVGG